MPAHSLFFSKSTKGAARLNVPIRRTNRYQQYYMPSQHAYCGMVWNLIQACDVQSSDQKVYISTPPSSEVENFQMSQRQTCYHPSQRDEQYFKNVYHHKYKVYNTYYYYVLRKIIFLERKGTFRIVMPATVHCKTVNFISRCSPECSSSDDYISSPKCSTKSKYYNFDT